MSSQPRSLQDLLGSEVDDEDRRDTIMISSDTTVEYEGEGTRSEHSEQDGSDSDSSEFNRASAQGRRRRRAISSSDEEDPFLDQFDLSQRTRMTVERTEVRLERPRATRRVKNLRRLRESQNQALFVLEKTRPQMRKRKFCWNEELEDDDNDQEDERSLKKRRKSSIIMQKSEKIQEILKRKKIMQ